MTKTSEQIKQRVGIFGGSFDPFHFGHLNSMTTVQEKMDLDKVLVVPSSQSPLKLKTQGATPEGRLAMLKAGLKDQDENFEITDLELTRGGTSYTIDTLKELQAQHKNDDFFLIIGQDQFEQFDQWKEFEQILDRVDLVVTSRPGMKFPKLLRQFSKSLQDVIEDFDGHQAILKSGKSIHLVQLEDVEASSSEIRRKLRIGQPIHGLVPGPVVELIEKENIYAPVGIKIGDFEKFTYFCANILKGQGGIAIRAFDLRMLQAPSEFSLVTSGTSVRHTAAMAENLIEEVRKEFGTWPAGIEGVGEGRWVVIDYGSLIIHVFYDFVRQEYRIESLWTNGKELTL